MYQLFITHTPMGVCYLFVKDERGTIIQKVNITPTAFFDLREKSIPEIHLAS